MHQFLFWWNDIGDRCLLYPFHLRGIDGAFRNCMDDGVGRIYWKCFVNFWRVHNPPKVGNKKATSRKPDPVVGYHLSVLTITCQHQSAYPVPRPGLEIR